MRSFGRLAMLAGASCAIAAGAQTGSLIPHHSSQAIQGAGIDPYNDALARLSDERALATARGLAACLVRDDPRRAGRFVLVSDREIAGGERVIHHQLETCLEGQSMEATRVRFAPPELQGFIAEALLKRSPPSYDRLAVVTVPVDLPMDPQAPASYGRMALDHTAACVVRTHPQQAIPLVLAAPGSADETSGFAAITPVLQSCIGPREEFRANRNAVRLAMAKAIYRQANAITATVPNGNH